MEANITQDQWRKLNNDVSLLTGYIIGNPNDLLLPEDEQVIPLRFQMTTIKETLERIDGKSTLSVVLATISFTISIICLFWLMWLTPIALSSP